VEEKAHHIEMWTHYLKTMQANRDAPLDQQRCEVYIDESYCHNYHHNDKNSVFDPCDPEHKQKPEKFMGRWYCFAAAIRGPDPGVRGSQAVLIPETLWLWEPKDKSAKNPDYHKSFNAENFAEWWLKQLLPFIPPRSVIIMDGASYHVARDPAQPKVSTMKKDELARQLQDEYTRVLPPQTLARDLMNALSANYALRPKHLERLTAEYNAVHGTDITILLTPPYLSDLQPIERLWAIVKNWVAAQYRDHTMMEMLEFLLRERFAFIADDRGQHREGGKTYLQAFIDTDNKHFALEMAVLPFLPKNCCPARLRMQPRARRTLVMTKW